MSASEQGVPRPSRLMLGLTGLEIEGGIASVVRSVATALDESIDAGHLQRADRVVLLDDVTAAPAPPRVGDQYLARRQQLRFALQLHALILRRRPDALFFDQLGPARSMQLPLLSLLSQRVPYDVFCHGIELGRAVDGSPHEGALRGARRLIANSQHTGKVLRTRFPECAERVVVTPLCIDPRKTRSWAAPERPLLVKEGPPVVLIIGRMWAEEPGKGHDALIEAWNAVQRHHPGAELWVIGGGDDQPRLEKKARELGLAQSVRFLGRVSDEEVARCFQRASLFAMPSQQEGFGLVYAEALWHGVPCIASNADAASEVVEEGRTGSLVPYGSAEASAAAIVSLLSDPQKRLAYAEAGFRAARERFGYERFRDDFLRAVGLPALAEEAPR